MKIDAYLVELDDVWMANFLKNIDLTRDSLHVSLILNPILLENLNGNLLACNRMRSNPHFSESARAKRPP